MLAVSLITLSKAGLETGLENNRERAGSGMPKFERLLHQLNKKENNALTVPA
jgi:hypothetical protein